jgi:hypothetical protein
MKDKNEEQTFSLLWKATEITIKYRPNYSEATEKIAGYRLAHLQVMSKNRTPLPMTETGYRSHFTAAKCIEDFASPIDFVKAWLAEAEQSKKWKAWLERMRKESQLNLF